MWRPKKDKDNERTALRGQEKQEAQQLAKEEKKAAKKAERNALVKEAFDTLIAMPFQNDVHRHSAANTWMRYEEDELTPKDLYEHMLSKLPGLTPEKQLELLKKVTPPKELYEFSSHETGVSGVMRQDSNITKELRTKLAMVEHVVTHKESPAPPSAPKNK